jgi:hypothetical protein
MIPKLNAQQKLNISYVFYGFADALTEEYVAPDTAEQRRAYDIGHKYSTGMLKDAGNGIDVSLGDYIDTALKELSGEE